MHTDAVFGCTFIVLKLFEDEDISGEFHIISLVKFSINTLKGC